MNFGLCKLRARSAIGHWRSAIGHQPSAIGHRPSAIAENSEFSMIIANSRRFEMHISKTDPITKLMRSQ
jgi:hypothetical protein